MGLCIFCRKNSFQGLGAINLGLIPKYWILHFWVKYLGFCGGKFDNFGRKDARRKNDNWFNLDDPIIL